MIASVVSSEREVEDARRAFKEARRVAKSKPYEVITDGLYAYEEAVTKEFWSRYKDERTEHKRHVRLGGDLTTNLIERLQGTVRERDKVLRGLKKDDSPIIKLMQAYYNFIRRHQGLGKTPAEAAGIGVGSGKHAWLELTIRSAVHKLVEGRGRLP
jgi:transposase-like protein